MKTVIIVNPEAGGIPDLAGFEDRLGPLAGTEILVTGHAGEERGLAEHAATSGVEQIVAAGGDGTVNEVVNGIVAAGADVRLGILPVGTANDYARSLRVPLEVEDAARVVAESDSERRVDLVELVGAEGRLFANLAVGGFGGTNGGTADREAKSRWGKLAYMLEAADEVPELRTYRVGIQCDEASLEELEVISLVVANGTTTGGGIRVAPNARLDDGQLDVIAIPSMGLPELAGLVPRILTGNHLEDDRLVVHRGQRVAIQADPPMPFRADGEDLGRGGLELQVRSGALSVVAGP